MTTSPTTLVRANWQRRTELMGELRSLDDGARNANRAPTTEEAARATEIRSELGEVDGRLDSLIESDSRSQELAAGESPFAGALNYRSTIETRSTANLPIVEFAAEDLREAFGRMGARESTVVETRSVPITGSPASAVGYRLDPVAYRFDAQRVATLIPTEKIEQGSVTFYRQTTGATAAAPVAPGAAKPQSDPAWTAVTERAKKIAHWTEVPSEGLADFSAFQQIVSQAMVGGMVDVENGQIVNGSGVGENLTGLLTATGILTYTPAAAERRIYSLLHAATLVRNGGAFTEPDTFIIHPTDWEIIQRTEDSTTGLVVNPNPTAGTPPTLWGTRVQLTTKMAAGTGIAANLAEAATVFSRLAPTLLVDPFSASTSNLVRFIAEERLALGVLRPAAVCKITFSGTT